MGETTRPHFGITILSPTFCWQPFSMSIDLGFCASDLPHHICSPHYIPTQAMLSMTMVSSDVDLFHKRARTPEFTPQPLLSHFPQTDTLDPCVSDLSNSIYPFPESLLHSVQTPSCNAKCKAMWQNKASQWKIMQSEDSTPEHNTKQLPHWSNHHYTETNNTSGVLQQLG